MFLQSAVTAAFCATLLAVAAGAAEEPARPNVLLPTGFPSFVLVVVLGLSSCQNLRESSTSTSTRRKGERWSPEPGAGRLSPEHDPWLWQTEDSPQRHREHRGTQREEGRTLQAA
jgi:hypothetical protein